MPAQPLKAMAVLIIAQKVSGNVLYGGGLASALQPVTAVYDPAGRFIRFVKVPGANGTAASNLTSNTKEPSEVQKTGSFWLVAPTAMFISSRDWHTRFWPSSQREGVKTASKTL